MDSTEGRDGPLLVSRDAALTEELTRLAAAAGVTPEVVTDPAAALPPWSGAPLVLVGSDCVGEVAEVAPERRARVLVLATTPEEAEAATVLAPALAIGAEHVLTLPQHSDRVVAHLTDLADPVGGRGRVLGVVGGSGGAGATTLACALGQYAGRSGASLVLDCDHQGPGVDRVLGVEDQPGLRWDEWSTTGRLGSRALREAVPRRAGVGALSWTHHGAAPLGRAPVREALSAAQRGHGLVVVDLPRAGGELVDEVAARCDRLLVVVRAGVSGVAAASRVVQRFGHVPALGVVTRGAGTDPATVGSLCGSPVVTTMRDQRGVDEAVDLGLGPLRSRRGPLVRAVADVLGATGDAGRGHAPVVPVPAGAD